MLSKQAKQLQCQIINKSVRVRTWNRVQNGGHMHDQSKDLEWKSIQSNFRVLQHDNRTTQSVQYQCYLYDFLCCTGMTKLAPYGTLKIPIREQADPNTC